MDACVTNGPDLICWAGGLELLVAGPAIGRPDFGGQFNRATAECTLGSASDHDPYIIHPRIALSLSLSYHCHHKFGPSSQRTQNTKHKTHISTAGKQIYLPFCPTQGSAIPAFVTDSSTLDSRNTQPFSSTGTTGHEGEALFFCLTSELTEPPSPSGATPCPVQHAAIVLRQRQQPFTSSDFAVVPRRPHTQPSLCWLVLVAWPQPSASHQLHHHHRPTYPKTIL